MHEQTAWEARLSSAQSGLKWIGLILVLSSVIGTLVALFLMLLESVTQMRWRFPELLFGLPLAGAAIVIFYKKYGRGTERGNDLLIEDLSRRPNIIPRRMAPIVFVSTLVTHLFGGSAGREGTAVQIGGSLGHTFSRVLKLSMDCRNLLIYCGMAAGIGAVFGTPLAGTVFAIELVGSRSHRFESFALILLASLLSDMVCRMWSVEHTLYRISAVTPDIASGPFYFLLIFKLIAVAVIFGLTSRFFSESLYHLKKAWTWLSPIEWLRPVAGAIIIIALTYGLNTHAYLGLGVISLDPTAPSIVKAFSGDVSPWSWFWKLVFTVVTLSSGFKGGEATPLFFIGACLGATLAGLFHTPIDLMAGLGFVTLFTATTRTPITGAVLGAELFGIDFFPWFALVCFIAHLVSCRILTSKTR